MEEGAVSGQIRRVREGSRRAVTTFAGMKTNLEDPSARVLLDISPRRILLNNRDASSERCRLCGGNGSICFSYEG
jgi:imidazoleglycerol phosphate dehydratase HisB